MKGCSEILDEEARDFDIVSCAAGTGTTAAGLLLSPFVNKLWCFPALKGGRFLRTAIERWILDYQVFFSTSVDEKVLINRHLKLCDNYHFGGYARINAELIEFMNDFYHQYKVPLDPVYTGKMMFGIVDMINKGSIAPGMRILAIHSGGLQGIKGMNQRLKSSGMGLLSYES